MCHSPILGEGHGDFGTDFKNGKKLTEIQIKRGT